MGHFIIFRHIQELLTLDGVAQKQGRFSMESDLGSIKDASLLIESGVIRWVGPEKDLSSHVIKSLVGKTHLEEIDCSGLTVLPAFVEAHTHTIFAGDRSAEWEQKLCGMSYQAIAEKGGGILNTVHHTRIADETELLELVKPRVQSFVKQGVGTLEIKSGYGLAFASEKKILQVASRIKGPRIVRTYLGPHACPPEFEDADDYMNQIVENDLPEIVKASLAERADVFIEKGYFSLNQAQRYWMKAQELGLGLTAHVDQFSRSGALLLGIEFGVQSVDHLVQISDEDINQLARSPVVCVLLPAADFYLIMNYPPARKLMDAGARVALATDFNPGSSPTWDLSFVGVLARFEMKMTLPEVIAAYTWNAACALGQDEKYGSLEIDKSADLILLDGNWRELFLQVGHMPVVETWVKGKNIFKGRSN